MCYRCPHVFSYLGVFDHGFDDNHLLQHISRNHCCCIYVLLWCVLCLCSIVCEVIEVRYFFGLGCISGTLRPSVRQCASVWTLSMHVCTSHLWMTVRVVCQSWLWVMTLHMLVQRSSQQNCYLRSLIQPWLFNHGCCQCFAVQWTSTCPSCGHLAPHCLVLLSVQHLL